MTLPHQQPPGTHGIFTPEGVPQSKLPPPMLETRVIALSPGLYLFRYATEVSDSEQIPITVNASPAGNGIIDFFPGEGVARNTLRKLGDTLVVRVLRAEAAILMAKYRMPGITEGKAAEVQIDRVDTSGRFVRQPNTQRGQPQTPTQAPSQPPAPFAVQSPAQPGPGQQQLNCLGHIQDQGDIQVANSWLGDPSAQSRLEGFAIAWLDKPQGVDLYYTCEIKGLGQTPPVSSGQFVGTRQKGAPILSVSMAISGPNAKNYQLSGQVAFQRCAPVQLIGERKLTGSQGIEPLVAINIQITHRQGAATPPRYPSPWDDPSVTQLFRQG